MEVSVVVSVLKTVFSSFNNSIRYKVVSETADHSKFITDWLVAELFSGLIKETVRSVKSSFSVTLRVASTYSVSELEFKALTLHP